MDCPSTSSNAPAPAAGGVDVAVSRERVALLIVASEFADWLACTGSDPAIQRDAAVLGALNRARLVAVRTEHATVETDRAVERARAEVARYSSSGSARARRLGGGV